MTEQKQMSDAEMEALFEMAADASPALSDGLLARIIADADEQDNLRPDHAYVTAVPSSKNASSQNVFDWLYEAIGGWPAVSGLAMATVAGVWIGYASPASISAFTDGFVTTETEYDLGDFMPSFDGLLGEG